MSETKREARYQKLPSGMIACLKPEVSKLTEEEMKVLDEYAQFCKDRSAKQKRKIAKEPSDA